MFFFYKELEAEKGPKNKEFLTPAEDVYFRSMMMGVFAGAIAPSTGKIMKNALINRIFAEFKYEYLYIFLVKTNIW